MAGESLLAELVNKALSVPTPPDPPEGIYPRQAVAGEKVITNDTFRMDDPRDKPTLRGKFSAPIVSDLIGAARRHGVDPKTAIAIALQETSLGKMQDVNPMHDNGGYYPQGNTTISGILSNMRQETAPSNSWYYENDLPHTDAIKFDVRNARLDSALTNLKHGMKKYKDAPEAHQLQAYNGLGGLKSWYFQTPEGRPSKAYGVGSNKELPEDFYGKRIQDIRDNVVNMSPAIKHLLGED